MLFQRLAQLGRTVRRNCNELVTQLDQLGFDASQLAELPVAVWSPSSAIKDQDGRLLMNCFGQIYFAAVNRPDGNRGNGYAGHQRANISRRRRNLASSLDHSMTSWGEESDCLPLKRCYLAAA